MSQSLTTLLDLEINHKALDQRFDLYKVVLANDGKKTDFAKQTVNIDKQSNPLGLIRHSKHYWVLKISGEQAPAQTNNMSFHKEKLGDCDDLFIGRLLTRALGKLAAKEVISGLGETYFYIEPDTYRKQTIHKCLSVDLNYSVRFGSPFLVFDGQVFSPTDIVYKSPQVIDAAPKFSFVDATGMLQRDPNGQFMVYSPGKGNFTTNAIDISGQKPISLRKTKTGALHHYINLMNTVFDGAFTVSLKQVNAHWRQHYNSGDIKKVYDQIYDVINRAGGIVIVNASLSRDGFNRLKKLEWPVDVTFASALECSSDKPLIVVLDSKEVYEAAGMEDRKRGFYSKSRSTQSIYNTTIMGKDDNGVKMLVDTWVKELAVKQECISGSFLIQSFNENYWFIKVSQKNRFTDPVYHTLKCEGGKFSYEAHDESYFEEIEIELPLKLQWFEKLCYVVDMSGNKPKICTIVHEEIAVVPDANVLFDILKNLEQGNEQAMTRRYIDKFLSGFDDPKEPIVARLTLLMEKFPNKQEFYNDELKAAEISYRSKAEKLLFDGYFNETGILLKYSIKGQHNEYLESMTGHFYDKEHSAYFVGMAKGGFKFSRGQFNHIRYLDGPDDLKQKCVDLTATYYVRNKMATVLPFPFKNLAECIELKKITAQ